MYDNYPPGHTRPSQNQEVLEETLAILHEAEALLEKAMDDLSEAQERIAYLEAEEFRLCDQLALEQARSQHYAEKEQSLLTALKEMTAERDLLAEKIKHFSSF